jgi:cystathionine beta-lyase
MVVGDIEVSRIIVEETKLFKITVSFGNVISLISLPCFMSHASIPAAVRAARGLPDDLVRISAGIEDVGDLIADLKQAMDKAMAAKHQRQQQLGASSGSSSTNGSSNGAGTLTPVFGSSSQLGAVSSSTDVLLAAAHSREQDLVQRIQQLESQLAHQNGAAAHVASK